MLIGAWFAREELAVVALLSATTALFVLLTLIFSSLTIQDEGEWLALRCRSFA
jgi:hypothetical protein